MLEEQGKEKLKSLLVRQIRENKHPCSCYERGDYTCGCDKVDRQDFIKLLEILLDE